MCYVCVIPNCQRKDYVTSFMCAAFCSVLCWPYKFEPLCNRERSYEFLVSFLCAGQLSSVSRFIVSGLSKFTALHSWPYLSMNSATSLPKHLPEMRACPEKASSQKMPGGLSPCLQSGKQEVPFGFQSVLAVLPVGMRCTCISMMS